MDENEEAAVWDGMRSIVHAKALRIISHEPAFRPRVAWCRGYDELFQGRFPDVTSGERAEKEILGKAFETGRILLSAEAGSGKTWTLARLALKASESEIVPVWVPLRDLPATSTASGDPDYIMRELVNLSDPPLKSVLKYHGYAPRTLVLADGLNEASREYVGPALRALDELARRYPFLSVVVTDRLARRAMNPDRWLLATVLPLHQEEIKRVWEKSRKVTALPVNLGLLTRPFFLDRALESESVGASGAATIEAFYRSILDIPDDALGKVSLAAMHEYQQNQSRIVDLARFTKLAGERNTRCLVESGTLKVKDEGAWFSHHLLHDFLVARHLAHNAQDWNSSSFDQVTLGAVSFDALRLAVEQIEGAERADCFISLVYDWNYSAAGYSLINGRVSKGMIVAVLAMLAEKRWDPVRNTVEEVEDALRLNGSTLSSMMLGSKCRSDLIAIVEDSMTGESDFASWLEMFSIEDGFPASPQLIKRLCVEDSLEGWALSNSLRRCTLDKKAAKKLVKISRKASPVHRWRAVHALGMHPSPRNASALQDRFADKDSWVRAGAIRSMVEQAALSGDGLRRNLLDYIISAVQSGRIDSRMLDVLAKSLNIRPRSDGWAESVAPLVQQLIGAAANLDAQERWVEVMKEIAAPDVDSSGQSAHGDKNLPHRGWGRRLRGR
ncbi:HEAT repeat domain-containing protein [Streptomyces sp. NPDC005402]|uniref:NACHT domain-containing protein n=1 Tax=Streptomyces sp. NPDC005402 TaxID=3155338 RepID=UPI0033A89AE4